MKQMPKSDSCKTNKIKEIDVVNQLKLNSIMKKKERGESLDKSQNKFITSFKNKTPKSNENSVNNPFNL